MFFDADTLTTDPPVSTDPANAVTLIDANQNGTHVFSDFVATGNEILAGTVGLSPFDVRDYGLGPGETNFDVQFAAEQTVFAGLFLDTDTPTAFDLTFYSNGSQVGSFVVSAIPAELVDVALPPAFLPTATVGFAVQIGFVSDVSFDFVEVREHGRDSANAEHFWLFLGAPVETPAPATATAILFVAGLLSVRLIGRSRLLSRLS